MSDISNVVTDADINKAIGGELRRIRNELGLTRKEVVTNLSSELSDQSLANYEFGIRPCTLPRLVEICETLGVPTASVVHLALQRAGIEPNPCSISVDLSDILECEGDSRLARWATKKRQACAPGISIVELEPAAVEEMAVFLDVPAEKLVRDLRSYTPARVPPRIVYAETG